MKNIVMIMALAFVPGISNAVDFDNPKTNDVSSAIETVEVAIPAAAQNEGQVQSFKNPKIVGGVEATKGEFPFIVSLQSNSYGHFCGGSLIKKNWVLTAAHCVEGGYLNSVVVGLHNLSKPTGTEKFKALQVIKHPKWNSSNMDFDFALIKLDKDSKFAPVTLNTNELTGKVDFVTSGWGTTSAGGSISDALLKVSVPLVGKVGCEAAYPGSLTDQMICAGYEAGGKDSCQGDSGGPLVVGTGSKTVLAGVVSWGEGCAAPKKYGVYAKVNAATAWIEATAK